MDIPQDIIDNVIAAVGYDDTHVLPSRKLFSRITLKSDQLETSQDIHHFLVENPVI